MHAHSKWKFLPGTAAQLCGDQCTSNAAGVSAQRFCALDSKRDP